MWSLQYYQSNISELLHKSLVKLCLENVPYEDKLEIDGIVCISAGDHTKQIVVKMHEILDSAYRELWHLSLQHAAEQEEERSAAVKDVKPEVPSACKQAGTSSADLPTESVPRKRSRTASPEPVRSSTPAKCDSGDLMLKLNDFAHLLPTSDSTEDSGNAMVATDIAAADPSVDPKLNQEFAYQRYRECSPVKSMLAFRRRPQRQRTPLAEELNEQEVAELGCKYCPQKFSYFYELQQHNQEAHKRFTCKQCYNTFSLPCNLRRHERLHTGLKPYSCNVCNTSFSRNGDLKVHMKKHKDMLVCSKCSKAFNSDRELQVHQCVAHCQNQEQMMAVLTNSNGSAAQESTDDASDGVLDISVSHSEISVSSKPEDEEEGELDHQMEWDRETDPQFSKIQQSTEIDAEGMNIENHVAPETDDEAIDDISVPSEMGQSTGTIRNDHLSEGSKDSGGMSDKYERRDSILSSSYTSTEMVPTQETVTSLLLLSSMVGDSSIKQEVLRQTNQDSSPLNRYGDSPASVTFTPMTSILKKKASKKPSKKLSSVPQSPSTSGKPSGAPREHVCRDCGSMWPDFELYESHCVGSHVRFPCKYCDQTFSNKNNRGRHERTHTGQKQHICEECGKSFTRSDTLKEHKIIHMEGYFGNQCFCGEVIEKKSDLLAHVKRCLQKKKKSLKQNPDNLILDNANTVLHNANEIVDNNSSATLGEDCVNVNVKENCRMNTEITDQGCENLA